MTVPVPVGDMSAVGIVAVVVMLVLFGKLRPNSSVQEVRQDRDARLAELCAESERWREAWTASEEARRELESSVDSLIVALTTVESLIRAIKGENGEDSS